MHHPTPRPPALRTQFKGTVTSVPPTNTGGNMDDRRVAKGATLYFPVEVAGAMLTMGDAHTAMGDSELDGTGIETSINGKFKVTLHKNGSQPLKVQVRARVQGNACCGCWGCRQRLGL